MMRIRNEAGAVTAETAVALPVLVILTAALAWMVALGATEVRAVDAARETARALARGEDQASSIALGQRIAPTGARFRITRGKGEVVVEVTAQVRGPRGVFTIPGFSARARAVAAVEPGS